MSATLIATEKAKKSQRERFPETFHSDSEEAIHVLIDK